MTYARIVGTGSYLPKKILTNEDLATMVDTSHQWIIDRTGIHQRHIISEDESTSSMALAASKEALQNAGIKATELDLIIVATITPDQVMPCVACILQHQIGAKQIIAFDLGAACAGFIYALGTAQQFIETGKIKTALVVGVEAMSTIIDWTDRSTCVLFGDGAGAAVLRADQKPGIRSCYLHADGGAGDVLRVGSGLPGYRDRTIPPYVHMEGREVFKFAVNCLGDLVQRTLDDANMSASDIDWLIPHQANIRIIQAVAKKLNCSMDDVIVTVNKHGNTSSASIPLALHDGIQTNKIKPGQNLLMEAFGGGIAWGSALITL